MLEILKLILSNISKKKKPTAKITCGGMNDLEYFFLLFFCFFTLALSLLYFYFRFVIFYFLFLIFIIVFFILRKIGTMLVKRTRITELASVRHVATKWVI
jgi:hypothetical protein